MPDTAYPPAPGAVTIEQMTLRLRGIRIEARIGVLPHERELLQPLLIDLDLGIAPVTADRIEATFDYACAAVIAAEVAARGHVGLVETFAADLAAALLAEPPIARVWLRLTKPTALAGIADAVGVELSARRG